LLLTEHACRQTPRLAATLAVLVTLVTIDAVVHIARHVVVLEVIRVVAAVTAGALEHGVVVGIQMACRANVIRVAVIGRELRVLCVIECGAGPGGRVVAGLAGGREELRLRRVTRIRRVVVIGLMAADARDWQRRVVVVHVAVSADARRNDVRTGQRERRVVVIKRGVGPDRRVMAKFARSREARGCVRRVRSARVILLVARVAECAVQRVVIVCVAVGAGARRDDVRTCQLESRAGVIEDAVGPENRVVAAFARRREVRRDVIHRRRGIVVVRLMATHARRGQRGVVVVGVAVGAGPGRHGVIPGQGERGVVVIKGRIRPKHGVVAHLARRGETRMRHGADGVGEIGLVTRNTERTLQRVVVVGMAIGAGARRHHVRTGQSEARG